MFRRALKLSISAPIVALLLLAACSDSRRPGGGNNNNTGRKDGGGDDATNNPIDTGIVGCACDVTPNVCDQACGCDPLCVGVDTGVPPNDGGGPLDGTPPFDGGGPNDTGNPVDGGPLPVFDGGVIMGDPFNASALASQYAQALCAFRTRCEPALYAFLGENETACRNDTTAAILNIWGAFDEAIRAGRAGFSQNGFNQCVSAYGSADCILGVPTGACANMFTGNRPVGVSCGVGIECARGNWCALQQLGGCGTCQPFAADQGSCANAPCGDGADCFDVGGTPTCVRTDTAEGQACGTVQDGLCQGRLQCVGPAQMPGQCRRPAGAGQTCITDGTAIDCNIYQNQICNAPTGGTCATVSFVGVGQSCAGTSQCNFTGRCDTGTTMCVALPASGQTCFQGVCAQDLYCDQGGTCQTTTPQGQTCASSDQCGDLYCVNQSCGPLDWQQCN